MPLKQRPVAESLGLCAVNLAIPGGGYVLGGDWRRGIALFVLLNGCFALGLAFNGTITLPAFSPRDPAFNVVAMLTFVVQAFHAGGVALLLALAGSEGPLARLLVRDPGTAFADLGAFHLLVAGGLNYFATVKLFDLLTGKEQNLPEKELDSKTGETKPGNGEDGQ